MRQKFLFLLIILLLAVVSALPVFGATITVTNTNDSGPGSLRQAIADAQPGDTINFSVTGTITLTSGTLTIGKNLTISGPGASNLAISGNNLFQGFFVSSGMTVTISGLTIENGNNPNGGGIWNQGTLSLSNSVVSGNTSGQGGGINNFIGATLTVTDSSISGNSASASGGGIYNFGTLTMTGSTISGNAAVVYGGGIINTGTLTVTNSTFSGNQATGAAGIYNGGMLYLTNSTFSGHSVGGIYNYTTGTLTVKSTLLAKGPGGNNCTNDGTFTSQGYNLSDDASCASLTQITDLNNTTAGLDPSGLQNNGGPTQTIALLGTSAAVDAIPVTDCTDVDGNPVTTDQRGVSRPQGPNCDIGAFEVGDNGPGKIVFTSNRDDISNFEIYSMNPNGSDVMRLTNNVAHDIEPVWSPDGSKIAFTSYRSGNPDIWVMDADGSNPTQLTTDTGADFGATWSPDGTKIAFTSTRNGGWYDVFVMNANNGTGQTNLTNSNWNELQPDWSPDGTKIAYTSDKNGGDFDVWVMNADGTGQTDLTQTGEGIHEQHPSWSPDGSKIAFDSNADGYWGIFVMNADGTGSTDVSGAIIADDPAWSPDGTKITFIKNYNVWVMNADGTSQVNVTNNAAGTSAQNPDWGLPATPSTLSVSAKLRIFAGPPPSFNLSANFTVGGSSDGINPLAEDVTLQVGIYNVTIPAGSFKQKEKGKKAGAYSFSGVIDGVTLSLQIVAPSVTGDDWSFKASGTPVDLTGLSNPITVMITIGDDFGTTEVDAIF